MIQLLSNLLLMKAFVAIELEIIPITIRPDYV